jgi:sugar transferase (PEP-CTERM/EpsH1 system associated)
MKRLLFIAHRMPYPPDKGERLRAFHEITALAEHFSITLAALAHSDGDVAAASELGRWGEKVLTGRAGGRMGLVRGALSVAAGWSATEGYFRNNRLLRALAEEAGRQPFDIVFGYSSSTLPYVLAVPAKARVMDLIDVDSAKWDSYAQAARGPKRWLYAREARGVRALERMALERCDAVFVVSKAEAESLGAAGDKVMAVGNGVDTEYFAPSDDAAGEAPSLVFTGTMDYRPNIDGVCWFVREVWPALKEHVPELTFAVVGRDPPLEVRRLAQVPGVSVTGTVPDVRPYLAEATAAVVPLRIARGIQNKVLEAMAMGRAVVASSGALEGLEIAAGTEALQADAPEEWTRSILGLLRDESRCRAMERAARARVVADYSWSARMAPLVALCRRLAGETAAGVPPECLCHKDRGGPAGSMGPIEPGAHAARPEGNRGGK